MVDTETLIKCVFKRGPIWDRRNSDHSNRNVVNKCWVQISREMNEDEVTLRKKWKYIRDQFAVEWGKIPKPRSGDGAEEVTSKWKYFNKLLFLKDIVKPRISSNNLKAEHESDPEETQESETNEIPSEEPPRKKKKWQQTFNDSLLETEEKRLDYLHQKKYDDEDVDFFKSLLPHVRNIPHSQKLIFRSNIQELVQRFAYPDTMPPSTPTSSISMQSDPNSDCITVTPIISLPSSSHNHEN